MLRLALTAGHYLYTEGKRCLKSIDPNETREWVLNDRVCDLVEKKLADYEGVQICRLDDTTGQKCIELEERKDEAEDFGADVYMSVHHNAGIKGGTGGGTVVYYYNTTANKARAQRIYNAVVGCTGLRGNRATPVANGSSLYECYKPSMPSYIIENGFMDSKTDTPIILTQEHAEKTAVGIVNFLVSEYHLVKKAEEPVSTRMFVPVNELKYSEVVMINESTLCDLAERYGKTVKWLLDNNLGIYRIDEGMYLVDKNTSICVD